MTGDEIKKMFFKLIDDEDVDDTFAYQLMNKAKNSIERKRPWVILRKLDESLSTTVGGTYTTSYDLRSDVRTIRKLFVNNTQWYQIPFERRIQFKDSEGYFFVDVVNNKLYLCGTVQTSHTISIFYNYKTPEITSSIEPVWPEEFHPLIPFEMAYIFDGSVDADAISFRMSDRQKEQRDDILDSMITWDTELQLAEMDGSASPHRCEPGNQDNRIPID